MRTSCGIAALTVACLLLSLLSGCASQVSPPTTVPSVETTCQTDATTEATVPTQPATTAPLPTKTEAEETTAAVATTEETVPETEETVPETEETIPETEAPTEPTHSEFYIPGLEVDDLIAYFNEVCLDAEFVSSGNPHVLQRWETPIYYILYGDYTDEDTDTLYALTDWLNTIEGFPGIYKTQEPGEANLRIHFCSQDEMILLMGDQFSGMDGAVSFWYMDDVIYDAIICYRSDLGQYLRNSVIMEEIYNGLGPIQDTSLREDSIIYQYYSETQRLSSIDKLIMRLLYHPDMQAGMDASECEQVIRALYY